MNFDTLFCGGMTRCGSTLQLQIAANLLERRARVDQWPYLEPEALDARLRQEGSTKGIRLISTNVVTPTVASLLKEHRARALYCCRDIRDVALAAMHASGVEQPTSDDLRWLETFIEAEELWAASAGVLVQRHEDLVADLPKSFAQIASHLGVALSAGEADSLAAQFALRPQEVSPQVGAQSATPHLSKQLHHAHWAPDGAECWQDKLPLEAATELTTRFRAWIERHRYPSHAQGSAPIGSEQEVFVPHAGWLAYEQGDDVLTGLQEGDFEYIEQATLVRILRPGDVFVDCGAHCGLFTKLAQGCLGQKGHVAAIEPDPQSFQRLERNTAGHGVSIVSRHRLALGDKNGTVSFAQEGIGRSAFNHVCQGDDTATIQVAQETLPSFVQRLPSPSVTVMKMDCEGSELAILRAAAPLLAHGIPKAIMIEFNSENLRRYGGTCEELVALLAQHGYNFYSLDPAGNHLEPRNPMANEAYANYFAAQDSDWLHRRFEQAPVNVRRKAADILSRGAHVAAFKRRLYATIDEQKGYINVLEKERARLAAEAESARADVSAARIEAQHHIGSLRAQLDQTVARNESLLAPLKLQLDKLAATSQQQTAYIATLEKERDRLAAEAKTAQADAITARSESQHHIDSLKAQLDDTVARYEQSIAELRPQIAQTVQRYEALISPLRNQLDQLAATSKQQNDHIAVLEKERDRLTEREALLNSEVTHYLDVIEDQLRYIHILEAARRNDGASPR